MDRRTRNLFAIALVVVIAITGGAALLLSDTKALDPDSPDDGGSFMVGVIVSVDAQGLSDVRGFELRRVDGAVVDFRLGELENSAAFPPGHLAEHQATGEPVRVWYRAEGNERFATRLEDAGG